MYNKPLIVFEGIEVSGKTTNIRIVSKLLRRLKKDHIKFTNKLKPDLTILSLVNEKNFKKRLNSRKNNNKYDKFNFSFYNKVQKGYIKIAKGNNRYLIIDSNKNTIKQNSDIIINSINKLI